MCLLKCANLVSPSVVQLLKIKTQLFYDRSVPTWCLFKMSSSIVLVLLLLFYIILLVIWFMHESILIYCYITNKILSSIVNCRGKPLLNVIKEHRKCKNQASVILCMFACSFRRFSLSLVAHKDVSSQILHFENMWSVVKSSHGKRTHI